MAVPEMGSKADAKSLTEVRSTGGVTRTLKAGINDITRVRVRAGMKVDHRHI